MSEQAEAMEAHYAHNSEWQELMGGDVVSGYAAIAGV